MTLVTVLAAIGVLSRRRRVEPQGFAGGRRGGGYNLGGANLARKREHRAATSHGDREMSGAVIPPRPPADRRAGGSDRTAGRSIGRIFLLPQVEPVQ